MSCCVPKITLKGLIDKFLACDESWKDDFMSGYQQLTLAEIAVLTTVTSANSCPPPTVDYTALLQQIADNTATSNTNELDIISILTAIKVDITAILNEEITQSGLLNDVLASINSLIADVQSGNLSLTAIVNILNGSILTELQAIEGNVITTNASLDTANISLSTIISILSSTASAIDTLIAEADYELIVTDAREVCIDGHQWLVRDKIIFDSESTSPSTAVISSIQEYSDDGVNWQTTQPTGVAILGSCNLRAVEYPFSATFTTDPSKSLNDNIASHASMLILNQNNVLSFSIYNDDDVNDLVFTLRGATTILKAGRGRTIAWGEGNELLLDGKFFDELIFVSATEITIAWEQL